jgi:hypothetical protein
MLKVCVSPELVAQALTQGQRHGTIVTRGLPKGARLVWARSSSMLNEQGEGSAWVELFFAEQSEIDGAGITACIGRALMGRDVATFQPVIERDGAAIGKKNTPWSAIALRLGNAIRGAEKAGKLQADSEIDAALLWLDEGKKAI